jgi:hypothetical protein
MAFFIILREFKIPIICFVSFADIYIFEFSFINVRLSNLFLDGNRYFMTAENL